MSGWIVSRSFGLGQEIKESGYRLFPPWLDFRDDTCVVLQNEKSGTTLRLGISLIPAFY